MASVRDFIQESQTGTVQHSHVIIQYQQPPDPAIINHALEILVSVTRNYAHGSVVQMPYIQDYLDQVVPFLQTLYSGGAQRVLQRGVPPPASGAACSPPACSNLQRLFNELSDTRTASLKEMTPLGLCENIERAMQPLVTSQVDREIEIQMGNKYSVNRILLQWILETVGQITGETLNRNPQQVKRLEPLVLGLYRQLTRFLFNLEAEENREAGQISVFPDVRLLVTGTWNCIWENISK